MANRVSEADNDDRSPTAKALSKVTEITTISLMMIIPAIIGYFVDQYFGTVILFTAIGLVIGMGSAIWKLIAFVSTQDKTDEATARTLGPPEEWKDWDDEDETDSNEDDSNSDQW